MASAATQVPVSPETVLAAMVTMRGSDSSKKKAAMDYLTNFQKSVCGLSARFPLKRF
jgi:hypothetical protein